MPTKTFQILKSSGKIMWGEWGAWMYDTWAEHNEKFFSGELKLGGIVWGLVPHGFGLGCYNIFCNVIVLHTAIAEKGNWRIWNICSDILFASDILLHEMMHQHIHQTGIEGKTISTHDSEGWVAEINRIAPILRFDMKAELVKRRRVKGGGLTWEPRDGYPSIDDMSHFPHLWRSVDFYGGYWGSRWKAIAKEKSST